MTHRKRFSYLALVMAAALAAAACGGDDPAPDTQAPSTTQAPADTQAPSTTQAPADTQAPSTTQAPPETTAAMAEPASVALVVNQRAGDLGPVDDMVLGLERAEAELGVETTFIEATDPSTFEATLRNLGNRGTDVVAVTFPPMADALSAVAPDFPDTRWIHIFGDPVDMPNVVTVAFNFYNGTYLAGILAGALSEEGKIGYVGGVSIPVINADYNAFVAGAQTQNPDIEADAVFANSFEDPAKGRELGAALYDGGADFVLATAAATTLGVVQAAEEKGRLMIGDTVNAFDSDVVVAATTVLWANTLFAQIENALSAGYTPGHVNAGVPEGGVDMLVNERFLDEGPADVVARIEAAIPAVDEARDQIRSGALVVEYNPDL